MGIHILEENKGKKKQTKSTLPYGKLCDLESPCHSTDKLCSLLQQNKTKK